MCVFVYAKHCLVALFVVSTHRFCVLFNDIMFYFGIRINEKRRMLIGVYTFCAYMYVCMYVCE